MEILIEEIKRGQGFVGIRRYFHTRFPPRFLLEEARKALETSHDAASEAAFEKAAEEAPPLEQMEEDEE